MRFKSMNKIKMIFSDIDGTLLTSEHKVTDRTKMKIKELDALQIPFVLVSARMPDAIYVIQEGLNIEHPIVCYGGGLILDKNREVIKSIGIDEKLEDEVRSYIELSFDDVCISSYSYNDWICDDINNPWIIQEADITGVKAKRRDDYYKMNERKEVHKILCMGEPSTIKALEKELKIEYPELSIYMSKDTYLEIMDRRESKSNAVKILSDFLKIDIEGTVSFGDNYNDVDMLKATAIGYAMGNAPDEVKKCATYVTLDNDNEGVLFGINQLEF
ncbi:Cof-type HAD-IIB family hydrolase [Clostridium paraputrificum]|uniref:Cof-type HAD-IIB family hydrolase n=1 Tax=Clostridium paraputrificum TaxID=29363 RepID=UPI00325AE01E